MTIYYFSFTEEIAAQIQAYLATTNTTAAVATILEGAHVYTVDGTTDLIANSPPAVGTVPILNGDIFILQHSKCTCLFASLSRHLPLLQAAVDALVGGSGPKLLLQSIYSNECTPCS